MQKRPRKDPIAWGKMFREFRERLEKKRQHRLTLGALSKEFSLWKLTDRERAILEELGAESFLSIGAELLSRYENGERSPDLSRILTLIYYFKKQGVITLKEANQWLNLAGEEYLYLDEQKLLFGSEESTPRDSMEVEIPVRQPRGSSTFIIPPEYVPEHTGYTLIKSAQGLMLTLIAVFILVIGVTAALLYGEPLVERLRRLFIPPSATPQTIVETPEATTTTPSALTTPEPTNLPALVATETIQSLTPELTPTNLPISVTLSVPDQPATLTVEARRIATSVAATVAVFPVPTFTVAPTSTSVTVVPRDTPVPTLSATHTQTQIPEPSAAADQDSATSTTSEFVMEFDLVTNANSRGVTDVSVELRQVTLMPDGRMRWRFIFNNQSNTNHNIELKYAELYLTDENAVSYHMIEDEAGTEPGGLYKFPLLAKAKRGYWIDFPAPQDGAQVFNVALATSLNSYTWVGFPAFNVTLDYDSSEQGGLVTATPIATNEVIIEPQQNLSVDGQNNVSVSALRVIILPDNRMRWFFVFENRSDVSQAVELNYAQAHLTDENGIPYHMLADQLDTEPGGLYKFPLLAKGKRGHWIDFPAPQDGATIFNVALATIRNSYTWAVFPGWDVILDYNSNEQSNLATATPVTANAVTIELEANVSTDSRNNVSVSALRVVMLPEDRMRWFFVFENRSDVKQEIELNYSQVYLTDENGSPYHMIADAVNTEPDGLYKFPVLAKGKRGHWIDFPAPEGGAREFNIALGTNRNSYTWAIFPGWDVALE